MKIRIYVSFKHIINGRRLDPFNCPIALAAKDIIPPSAIDIQVETNCLGYKSGKKVFLPRKAIEWIREYDEYGYRFMPPIDFVVEI